MTGYQQTFSQAELVAYVSAGPAAPVKLVDDTFVNADTGEVVELHGMSWVGAQL